MKSLSFIIVLCSVSVLFSACREIYETCLAFPNNAVTYFATQSVGQSVTYYVPNVGDSVTFYCNNIKTTNDYEREVGCRCMCESYAKQVMTTNTGTLIFTKTGNTSAYMTADHFMTWIDISAFGIVENVGFFEPSSGENGSLPDNMVQQKLLTEWRAADGHVYQNVYSLRSDMATCLYLAPGLGLVQIETPDKTYVLKQN